MKKQLLFSLSLFLIFSASAFAQKIKVDLDKTIDFSKYKTYKFMGWQENIDSIVNDFDKKRISSAFMDEMNKRKLELVDSDPDMLMATYLVIDQKTSITGYTNYMGGMGVGFRGGWGWGMGSSTTNYTEDDYLQGTMVIDFYDGDSKKLIWQATGVGTVNEKPEKREKTIPKTIAKMLKQFPIQPVN